MPRRHFTVGRAFVLLILGIAIGAGLYIARHLRPESLKEQVLLELRKMMPEAWVEDVVLGLNTGVEVVGLRVNYPDGMAAIQAERVSLMVDHGELLRGEINIRQIDISGLVVRLRKASKDEDVPTLPGVFADSDDGRGTLPRNLPVIRVLPGDAGSRIEVFDSSALRAGVLMNLTCAGLEGHPDGPMYGITADFEGERVEALHIQILLDPTEHTLKTEVTARAVTWERKDVYLLSKPLLDLVPPVELGGEADLDVKAEFDLRDLKRVSLEGKATFRNLVGVFGNVHTYEPKGLPFALRDGSGELTYKNGVFALPDLRATYVSPKGRTGTLDASFAMDISGPEPTMNFAMKGRTIQASTEDLRNLLPPDVRETIIEQFVPSGSFDFDLSVVRAPGAMEKVDVELRMEDGSFAYAGQLDELTGKRFGFRYPVDRCAGRFRLRTQVPTDHGPATVIDILELRGYNRVAGAREGDPRNAAVQAEGKVVTYVLPDGSEPEDVDVRIHVQDLPIDAKLATAFASTPDGMPYRAFDLTGWAETVEIHIERDGFKEDAPRAVYDVRLKDCSMAYKDFPLRVERVGGRIVSRDTPADEEGRFHRILDFQNLEGEAIEGGIVRCNGWVRQGEDHTEELDLTISAEDLTVGKELEKALMASPAAGAGVTRTWQRLRPHGKISVTAKMSSARHADIVIDLAQTTLGGYGDIDCPITHLGGQIRYVEGEVTLRGVHGKIFDAPFHISGSFKEGGRLALKSTVDHLVLSTPVQQILEMLAPDAKATIDRFGITDESSLNLTIQLDRATADDPVDVVYTLDGLAMRCRIQGMDVVLRGGPLHSDKKAIHGKNLWLKSTGAEVHILEFNQPHDVRRPQEVILDAFNLVPQDHLLKLFGPALREVLGDNLRVDLKGFRVEYGSQDQTIVLSGAIDLRRHRVPEGVATVLAPTGNLGLRPLTLRLPRKDGDPLRFHGVVELQSFNMNLPIAVTDMSGTLLVAEGTLAPEFTLRGAVSKGDVAVFEREVKDATFNLSYRPEHLHLSNIDGRFYSGYFRGDVEVHLTDPGPFKVNLRASDVQLGEMLKEDLPRSEQMSGIVEAAIEFESASGDLKDVRGRGEVRVSDGQLFRVPSLRRVLSVLSRATPLDDAVRFKRAEADFTINGDTLEVEEVHLATNLNDIYSRGTVTIYGDLDLVVEPQVTRLIDLPRLINLPVLSALRDLWHKTVYEIRLEGTIDSPALRLRGLPFLKSSRRPFTQSPHAGRAERMRPRLLPGAPPRTARLVPVGTAERATRPDRGQPAADG